MHLACGQNVYMHCIHALKVAEHLGWIICKVTEHFRCLYVCTMVSVRTYSTYTIVKYSEVAQFTFSHTNLIDTNHLHRNKNKSEMFRSRRSSSISYKNSLVRIYISNGDFCGHFVVRMS